VSADFLLQGSKQFGLLHGWLHAFECGGNGITSLQDENTLGKAVTISVETHPP
jgi:hypothetical protein